MTAVSISLTIHEKSALMRFPVGHMLICTTDLFVLVSSDRDELCFGERLAADHLLDASNLHDVYPRLVLVQRIQHDLKIQINYYYYSYYFSL